MARFHWNIHRDNQFSANHPFFIDGGSFLVQMQDVWMKVIRHGVSPDCESKSYPYWAIAYIGRPWHAGARGPEAFDCWGLFLAIQREHFGRDLPEIPVDANDLRTVMTTFRDHPERQRWAVVSQPAEGDAVLLRQSRHPVHVGVWLAVDGGGVLHAVKDAGVVFQKLPELLLHGWRVEGYYRFVENQ
jgi:hypothetical protein